MVKELTEKERILYTCEECGFRYAKREVAEQCETWCKEHQSCNLEIIAQGMPPLPGASLAEGGPPEENK